MCIRFGNPRLKVYKHVLNFLFTDTDMSFLVYTSDFNINTSTSIYKKQIYTIFDDSHGMNANTGLRLAGNLTFIHLRIGQ